MTDRTPAKTGAATHRAPDLYSQFRGEMDRLFDSFFGSGPAPRGFFDWPVAGRQAGGQDLMPQLELTEDDKGFRLACELPGLDGKDVEVTLADGLLTIKGEKKSESKSDKDNVHVTERRYGSFLRQVRLPDSIDEDKVKAAFDKGVLTVQVAKKPEAVKAPRKIAIGKSA